jgi:phage terminase large subunit
MTDLVKTFHDYQWQVLKSEAPFTAAIAGVQSGKTIVGAAWLAKQISDYPQDDHLIAAPTYKILEQSTLTKFFSEFPQYRQFYRVQGSVIDLPEGGHVFIRSTEDPYKLEGMTLRSAWLDEGGQMKPAVWIVIQARLSIKRGKLLITTTPYNMGWLYTDFYKISQSGDPSFNVISWSSELNPFFPKEEFERVKKTMDATDFEMRYMGQFRKRHGLVYPDFGDHLLFTDKPTRPLSKVIGGVDWGFTNPSCILVVAIDYDRHYWVLDEYYAKGKTTGELIAQAKLFQTKHKVNTFYADSAEPDRIEEARRQNLYVQEANKDIKLGVDVVRQLTRERRLHVHKSCINLVDEFENYHYPEEGEAGFVKDLPKKEYDHALDALRYAVFTEDPSVDLRGIRQVIDNRRKPYQFN